METIPTSAMAAPFPGGDHWELALTPEEPVPNRAPERRARARGRDVIRRGLGFPGYDQGLSSLNMRHPLIMVLIRLWRDIMSSRIAE